MQQDRERREMRLQRKTAAIADHSSDEESDGDVDEYGGDFLGDAHRYPLNVSHLAVAVDDSAQAIQLHNLKQ